MPGLQGCCMLTGAPCAQQDMHVYTELGGTLAVFYDMLINVAIGEVGPCDQYHKPLVLLVNFNTYTPPPYNVHLELIPLCM